MYGSEQLPLALIFAWRYDVTASGIVRTTKTGDTDSADPALSRVDYFVLVSLALALSITAYAVTTRIWNSDGSTRISINFSDRSVAVLPFDDLSEDDDSRSFTVGIHDDTLTQISKVSGLRVISRSSVQQVDMSRPIQEIGKSLGVATVLEGGVQRSGNRVRINVKLIDSGSGANIWAETYDRQLSASNIFVIQSEIAKSIASQLRTKLTARETQVLSSVPTSSLLSYDEYLMGRQAWELRTSESIKDAICHFESAIAADPEFAPAYVGLADCYLWQYYSSGSSDSNALTDAESAISFALSLNEDSSNAQVTYADLKRYQYDFDAAESAYVRAIHLNPNNSTAYESYADMLAYLGRRSEALGQLERARKLNPLSAAVNINIAYTLGQSGQTQEALAQHKKIMQIAPDSAVNCTYWECFTGRR
jgi:TolB-like protein/thioredoxin-like negative regulator of GroEL